MNIPPPECIAEAIVRKSKTYREFSEHELAQAVWDALLAEGERWQRIGRTFYDDTDEGTPVLVLRLDG